MKSSASFSNSYKALKVPNIRQLSAAEFLEFTNTSSNEIKSSKFIPPKLGDKGFGYFEVETKTPYFEVTSFE